MPAKSFGCKSDDMVYLKQVLPGLLKRTKTQTIRPLFERTEIRGEGKVPTKIIPKPNLKVGDITTFYWKMRSSPKDSQFCSVCGTVLSQRHLDSKDKKCFAYGRKYRPFPKLLGKVEITEVFEIELWKAGMRIQKLDELDRDAIERFINAYRGLDHHAG